MNEEIENFVEAEEEDRALFHLPVIWILILIFFGFLLLRLINLTVIKMPQYRLISEGNRLRTRFVPPPRGLIEDRFGATLVKNTPTFSLVLYPAELPFNKEERRAVLEKTKQDFGLPPEKLEPYFSFGKNLPQEVVLAENIDPEKYLFWKTSLTNDTAVDLVSSPRRSYETTGGLAHILGYLGKAGEEDLKKDPSISLASWLGKTGLEGKYDDWLKGQSGRSQMEVDARGRAVRALAEVPPEPGKNLILNLDFRLQKIIFNALSEGMEKAQSKAATAVALDPRDGGVLALVSLPTFDNNLFFERENEALKKLLKDEREPLVNRVTSGLYPSGSTIKPLIAAAALEEGVISENTNFYAPAEIKVGDFVFPDWKEHGTVDVKKAISQSSNVFFYAVAGGYDRIRGLGINRLADYFQKFGLGKITGIDIGNEKEGLVPTPEWKKRVKKENWFLGDTYHLGIGQGDLLITPLQLANALTAIANGGELLKPEVLRRVEDNEGKVIWEIQKEVLRENFIQKKNIEVVREGMRETVLSGSARQLADLKIEVAGKTGTAQFPGSDKTHAWFAGFAPYNDPKMLLLVMVEGGGEGHSTAVPIFKKIIEEYLAVENSWLLSP